MSELHLYEGTEFEAARDGVPRPDPLAAAKALLGRLRVFSRNQVELDDPDHAAEVASEA